MKENPTTNQPFPRRSRTAARSEPARGSPCCEPRGIPAAGAAPQSGRAVPCPLLPTACYSREFIPPYAEVD